MRCHFLLRLVVCEAEALRVDDHALDGVDHGQTDSVCGQHEVLPDSVVQVFVIRALILDILRSLDGIVEHRAVTALHWLIFVQRPGQDPNVAVNGR